MPSDYPRAKPDSVGVPPQAGETVLVAPFNETAAVVAMIERHAHELAAVIVEPLQRVLLPEPGFLEAVREVTRRHGIVLVFDEIVTGFRIAWGGAQEKYGVVPGSRVLRQGGERGLSARGHRRPRRRDGRARRTLAPARRASSGRPIRSTAIRSAPRRDARRSTCLSQPGVYDAPARASARGCARASSRPARGTASPCRRPARMPCSACASPTAGRCAPGWTSPPRTRTWATAGRIELIKRGLVVNPNEKFYISIVHTDADVDRTLAIVDEAFRALRA